MILLKITNEQILALKADAAFTTLADSLLAIQSLRTARDYGFKPRIDGWIEVSDEYLPFNTLLALESQHGIGVDDVRVYLEVPTSNLGDNVFSYLADATYIDEEGVEQTRTWNDLVSRTSLDGLNNIISLSEMVPLADVATLLGETTVTTLNHPETLARIALDYDVEE